MSTENIPFLKIIYPRYSSSRAISYKRMEDQGLSSDDIKTELFNSSLKRYKEAVDELTMEDCYFEETHRDINLEDEARG